jgi:zeaxanthin glucosyltransferase
LKAVNVEALVVDTAYAYSELAAASLGLPYVQTCLVLNFDASGATPPNLFDWPHQNSQEARTKNLEGVRKVGKYFLAPSMPVARVFAEESGLAIDLSDPASSVSDWAAISQTPQVFDYPDIPWFPQFHYTGPFFITAGRNPIPFDWDKLARKIDSKRYTISGLCTGLCMDPTYAISV